MKKSVMTKRTFFGLAFLLAGAFLALMALAKALDTATSNADELRSFL